ncbi:MAG: hypothetical protein HYT65_02685 [Candidatus Yanofskybacteria bacterium]|nr:hypothetical protein [Candidatus Yanofskybacteria bacterium]
MTNTANAIKAKRPELVFDGHYYTITKIPLNYRIVIKYKLKKKIPNHGIDRDCYSDIDLGIGEAHEVARKYIHDHFVLPD